MNFIKKMVVANICALFSGTIAVAEPISIRPEITRPDLPEYSKETNDQNLALPEISIPENNFSSQPVFLFSGVRFSGNTVFNDKQLEEVAKPYFDKYISLAELEELRFRLTNFYVEQGYINSGVLIQEGQEVKGGIVNFKIIEGKLQQIRITGNKWLRPGYLKYKIRPIPEEPFNTNILQDNFRLLLQDPLIKQLNGKISPSANPGEAILDLDVTRAKPYSLFFTVDNARNPNTGSEQASLEGNIRNLTGFGDYLSATGFKSEGTTEFLAHYEFMILYEMKISFDYNIAESETINDFLTDNGFQVDSEFQSYELSISGEKKTLHKLTGWGVSFALKESTTYLMGMPFSFSAGAEDGVSKASVFRLFNVYQKSNQNSALALRWTLSYGLTALGATDHGHLNIYSSRDFPDSEVASILAQSQYARYFGEKFGKAILRADLKMCNDKVLSIDKFSIGGAGTVRGYRENEVVRDNGAIVSAEWQYPLWNKHENHHSMLFAAFIDGGAAWNYDDHVGDKLLWSIGGGIIWNYKIFDAQLYYAQGMEELPEKKGEKNLQDDGIHFKLSTKIF
jgi:hemolysin activation/secretion protein